MFVNVYMFLIYLFISSNRFSMVIGWSSFDSLLRGYLKVTDFGHCILDALSGYRL